MTLQPQHIESLAQHLRGLRSLARALTAGEHEADDLLQDAYLLAARHPGSQRSGERSWLARILRNLSRSRFRSAERRVRREARSISDATVEPASADLAARRELLDLVTRAVLELDAPLRDAVMLCYFEERTQDAAARALDITIDALRHRLHLALRTLRARLDRTHGTGAWSVPLCTLLGLPPSPISVTVGTWIGGGFAMKKLLGLAAAILLFGLGTWWWSDRPHDVSEHAQLRAGELASAAASGEVASGTQVDRSPEQSTAESASAKDVASRVAPSQVAVIGKVISQRRRGVRSALITYFAEERRLGATETDAEGAFRFELEAGALSGAPFGWVHAVHGDEGAAIGTFGVDATSADDARTIDMQLAPASSTSIVVMGGERGVPYACVRLERLPEREAIRGRFAGLWRCDDAGRVVLPPLPHGSHAARVFASSGQSGFAQVDLPSRERSEWILTLAPPAALAVSVVERGSGTPITGARVRVESYGSLPGVSQTLGATSVEPELQTDEHGRCRFDVIALEPHALEVAVQADGYQPRLGWHRATFARRPREVRIELHPQVTISWPIAEGELPIPPEGTIVQFCRREHGSWQSYPPISTGRIEGGHIVVPGLESKAAVGFAFLREGMAVLPDGAIGHCRYVGEYGVAQPVRFRRPRALEVKVHHADGRPAAGVKISARWNAGYAMGVPLDADGLARLVGFYGASVEVFARMTSGGGEWYIGTADLEAGDAALEHVLLEGHELHLDLKIDGKRGLPPRYEVRAEPGRVEHLGEDPARGRVLLRVHPADADRPMEVTVRAAGYQEARTRLDPPHASVPIVRELELVGLVALAVQVLPPSDGLYRLVLHRHDARWGGWVKDDDSSSAPRADHYVYFEDLPPGQYRVRDELSGATSAAIELDASGSEVSPALVLDLSRAGDIEGRVVTSALGAAALEWFGLERRNALLDPLDVIGEEGVLLKYFTSDGAFRWRVPGDQPIELRAWHPQLIAHPERGIARISGPRSGIELELIEGPSVRFEWVGPVSWDRVRLAVFEAHRCRVERRLSPPQMEGTQSVLRGLPPGRYDFFFDVQNHAPIWLRDIEVRFPSTDLGSLTTSEGSAVSVALRKTNDKAEPPRWLVSVQSSTGPSYGRGPGRYAATREQRVTGLRAGLHVVRVHFEGGGEQLHTVEFDGRNELRLELTP